MSIPEFYKDNYNNFFTYQIAVAFNYSFKSKNY